MVNKLKALFAGIYWGLISAGILYLMMAWAIPAIVSYSMSLTETQTVAIQNILDLTTHPVTIFVVCLSGFIGGCGSNYLATLQAQREREQAVKQVTSLIEDMKEKKEL